MKQRPAILLLIAFLFSISSVAQTNFYKGEWREQGNTTTLFSCIAEISFTNDSIIAGKIIWTYQSIDSTDADAIDFYKDKKGLTAIEYLSGIYHLTTGDVLLMTDSIDDKHEIIAPTIYYLKLSTDKTILFGSTTTTDDADPGIQYLVRMERKGRRNFIAQINRMK
jgi:hypothetical protein